MVHEHAVGIPNSADTMARGVERAIATRRSVRAFSSRSVSADVVASMVRTAARAPTFDTDEWNVWVLDRPAIERIGNAVRATGGGTRSAANDHAHRRLYDIMGVSSALLDHAPRVHPECDLLTAPCGVIVTSNRVLDPGSWVEIGTFVQSLLLLASERDLAGTVQTDFAPAMDAIHPALGVGYDQALVCAVALGYENRGAPSSPARTPASGDRWLRVVR